MQCEVHDKLGNHCPNEVSHKFPFQDKEVHLCSQCFANVCSGAYGIDLQLSTVASNNVINLTRANSPRRLSSRYADSTQSFRSSKKTDYELRRMI